MRRLFLFLQIAIATTLAALPASAQLYEEPKEDNTHVDETAWAQTGEKPHFTWADADVHHERHCVPAGGERRDTVITVWRGERFGLRGMLFGGKACKDDYVLTVKGKSKAPAAKVSWLRYVITDSFSTCGYHPDSLKPYTVAEVIDLPLTPLKYEGEEVRPFWMTAEIPQNCPAGEYKYTIQLKNAKGKQRAAALSVKVRVLDRQLPCPGDYKFRLNLWQQPYSIARYYNVKPWSKEHFDIMRPYMEELARCGQKVVSAILFYEPWGQQSNDKFQPMIEATKRVSKAGEIVWTYDYTVFDRWVEFMESCGIHEQIDCYSMVPWDMTFRYYDEARRDTVNVKTTTDAPEYREIWNSFLRGFATHLKKKGWFEKTCIAMDERGLEDMKRAYSIAQEAVPGIKMTLAGNYHKELADCLHDYSVAYGQDFSDGEKDNRRQHGKHSTYYTCCTDAHPGLFSNSNPIDATFIPLYAAAADFDGWLHWSWINWTNDPLRDSRFFLFAPGDTYFYYPGPRSSLRHERLLEGIQQYEKICIMRGDKDLEATLHDTLKEPAQDPAALAKLLNRFKLILNK